MATHRHQPGDPAPSAGTYALVGRDGKFTNFTVWCEKGERLPLVTVTADVGLLRFILVARAIEDD